MPSSNWMVIAYIRWLSNYCKKMMDGIAYCKGQSYHNNEYFPTKQQQETNGNWETFHFLSLFYFYFMISAEVHLQRRPAPADVLPVRSDCWRARSLPQQDLHLQPEARRPEL